MTTIEAENAFALSVVEAKTLDPVIIAREKAQAVKKSGLLELVETKESLDSVGGADVLKSWLVRRKHAFSQKARNYALATQGSAHHGHSRDWKIAHGQSHGCRI